MTMRGSTESRSSLPAAGATRMEDTTKGVRIPPVTARRGREDSGESIAP